jgi:flavin-binding protein dodecin
MRISLLLCCGILIAAEPNTLTPEEKKQGWKLLFDGKSMKGWGDIAKKSPAGDAWSIDTGALKAAKNPKLREDLFTDASYGDFELSFEWKISPGGNSGLKYRVQDRFYCDDTQVKKYGKFETMANDAIKTRAITRAAATQEYVVGFEFQVIDDSGHVDARRGALYQAGALYSMLPAGKPMAKPVGEYNQARVVVRGDKIEHWLNGVKVVDGSLADESIKARAAARWTTDSLIYKGLAGRPKKKTPITLQNHGDEAWFRNIKIRPL